MLWFDRSNVRKSTTCPFQTNQLIPYVRFNHPVFSYHSNHGSSDPEEKCWTITHRIANLERHPDPQYSWCGRYISLFCFKPQSLGYWWLLLYIPTLADWYGNKNHGSVKAMEIDDFTWGRKGKSRTESGRIATFASRRKGESARICLCRDKRVVKTVHILTFSSLNTCITETEGFHLYWVTPYTGKHLPPLGFPEPLDLPWHQTEDVKIKNQTDKQINNAPTKKTLVWTQITHKVFVQRGAS